MQEIEIIELETTPILLDHILEDAINPIHGVIFDIDNTLLSTDSQFTQWQNLCSLDILENFPLSSVNADEFVRRMEICLNIEYEERLSSIEEVYIRAFLRYFNGNEPDNIAEIMDRIRKNFEDFYDTVPEIKDGVVDCLNHLREVGIPFGLNSLAQLLWTAKKTKYLENITSKSNIPFNAVDITQKKDSDSWKRTAEKIGIPIEEALVIGDNWNSDIMPAVLAGCKNVVWINPRELSVSDDFFLVFPDVSLCCVKSIKDLIK